MSKKKVFHSFSDSGHGWVRVSIRELVRMDIVNKITSYSYLRGEFAYLEEDKDLTTFVERKKEMNESFSTKLYSSTERKSKIRGYDAFYPEQALEAFLLAKAKKTTTTKQPKQQTSVEDVLAAAQSVITDNPAPAATTVKAKRKPSVKVTTPAPVATTKTPRKPAVKKTKSATPEQSVPADVAVDSQEVSQPA